MSPYQPPLRFGPFVLDPETLELERDGHPVPIEPLPARLLLRLARNPGRMVSREELRNLGWPKLPGAAEQSLNTCAHQIRQALAAGGPSGVELETLRGRGYRLKAPAGSPARAGTGATGRPGRLRAWIQGAAAAAALVAATAFGAIHWGTADPPEAAVPDEAQLLLSRATYLLYETGDPAGALAVLDSGRVAYPDAAAFPAMAGEIQIFQGADDAGRRAARQALALDPRNATAHRALGAAALAAGSWEDAEASFEASLELDPTDATTWSALAYLHAVRGDRPSALHALGEALRADPMSATIHQDAGLTFLLVGRFDDALRSCEEALRFRPESAWALGCAFDASVLAGRADGTMKWGRRVLERLGDPPPEGVGAVETARRVQQSRIDRWEALDDPRISRIPLARAYAALGRTKDAMTVLEEEVARRHIGLSSIAVDPRLAPLRDLRGFTTLLHRVLPPGDTAPGSGGVEAASVGADPDS